MTESIISNAVSAEIISPDVLDLFKEVNKVFRFLVATSSNQIMKELK